jgi:hypothetical protein
MWLSVQQEACHAYQSQRLLQAIAQDVLNTIARRNRSIIVGQLKVSSMTCSHLPKTFNCFERTVKEIKGKLSCQLLLNDLSMVIVNEEFLLQLQ